MGNAKLFSLVIFVLFLATFGCANRHQTVTEQVSVVLPAKLHTSEQDFWWYVRYKINWPENSDPDFSIDALLADAVIEPILIQHQDNISLWRFHRRANRDNAGHQFSFIFYSGKTIAKNIFDKIKDDQLTNKLLARNIVDDVITDNLDNNKRSHVEDASDKNWSSTLQNAWPAFIMGVSATWLQLINQQIKETISILDLDKLLIKYRNINIKVNEIWYKEGQHAFFHHLNALFGYEPLKIEQSTRF